MLERSPLSTGERLSHPAYEQLKGELLRAALGNGYLDAASRRANSLVDPATHTAARALTLETGERYRFGPTTIEQDVVRARAWRGAYLGSGGRLVHAEALLRTQFALDDSQYFSLARCCPGNATERRRSCPIRITSEPNRRHVYTIAAGYGTDTGAAARSAGRTAASTTRGHRLRAQVQASTIEESVSLNYIIPWTDPALEKLSYELRNFNEQRGGRQTIGSTFTAGLTQVRGRWQRVLSVILDPDRGQDHDASRATRPMVDSSRSRLLVPGHLLRAAAAGFPRRQTRARRLPRRAARLDQRARFGHEFHAPRRPRRAPVPLTDKWQVYVRGEVGASRSASSRNCRPRYRFFAGGDNSVRGYGYEELSPVDAIGNKVGGRHMLTGTVELQRDLPKNLVAAVFVDAGNAFNKFGDPLEYSVGIGDALPVAVPEYRHRRRAVDLGVGPQPALSHQLHAGVLSCAGQARKWVRWLLAANRGGLLVAIAPAHLARDHGGGARRAVAFVESWVQ